MSNQTICIRAHPHIGNLAKLVVFSYATLYEYTTKIRLLNKETRKQTANSYIAREHRNWTIHCTSCWLCLYEPRHLQAVLIGADTMTIHIEAFVRAECEVHRPFK